MKILTNLRFAVLTSILLAPLLAKAQTDANKIYNAPKGTQIFCRAGDGVLVPLDDQIDARPYECSNYDGSFMLGQLQKHGYTITSESEQQVEGVGGMGKKISLILTKTR